MLHLHAQPNGTATCFDELSHPLPGLTLLSFMLFVIGIFSMKIRMRIRRPLISPHFNITVELPLKAITRGYSWISIPITWHNRRSGESKLRMKEMGSRYLFICLYILLEKWLSLADYRKNVSFTS